jgi:hypothetical protein
VELWLELTEIPKIKQGIALVGRLMGEPKEFAKSLSTELLIAENYDMTVNTYLDKACMDSTEIILNTRVYNVLSTKDYQKCPLLHISLDSMRDWTTYASSRCQTNLRVTSP